MPGGAHDLGANRRHLGLRPVHLDPDFDTVSIAIIAEFAKAGGDVRDRGLFGDAVRQSVGAYFHAPSARIVCQVDELLSVFDLLFALGRVWGVELARCAVAAEPHFTPGEAVLHARAFRSGARRLDAVLMRSPQLDRLESGSIKGFDDRFEVHVLENVVRHRAELHGTILFQGAESSKVCEASLTGKIMEPRLDPQKASPEAYR